ncbi:hypothetical protein N9Y67_00130 [Pseudomonadota bacterium]|nr:hypothetical protein [Pseudomonadota bacterium]
MSFTLIPLMNMMITSGAIPAPAVPSMNLGINTNFVTSYSEPVYFSNIARQMGSWFNYTQDDLTGIAQRYGKATFSTSDEFRAYLSDEGKGLPHGTYTVRWTGAGELAIGDYGHPEILHSYDSSGAFTFEYTGGFIGAWFKGASIESLQIILPGQVSAHDGGNEWNSDYLSYYASLGTKKVRGMNWVKASDNFEENWADSVKTTDISYQSSVPISVMADFANRTSSDIWYNMPPRVTAAYAEQAGIEWKANLDAGRKLYLEFGNEIWHFFYVFADGTRWTIYLNHPRYEASADSINNAFTRPNHGMATGNEVRCFTTLATRQAAIYPDYRLIGGSLAAVNVIDTNTFKLEVNGAELPVAVGMDSIIFIKMSDAGVVDLNANFIARNEMMWQEFEKNMSRADMHYVVATHNGNTGITQERYDALTDKTAPDSFAPAPYYAGCIWGVATLLDSTVMTPAVYSTDSESTDIYFALYLTSANPSVVDIMNGTNAIASEKMAGTGVQKIYTSGAQVTGLTDSENYTAHYVLIDSEKHTAIITEEYTQPSTATVLYKQDAYTNQKNRELTSIIEMTALVAEHKAIIDGLDITCYEGGPHYHHDMPSEVKSWLYEYWLSNEAQEALELYFKYMATAGVTDFFFFQDAAENRFGLATSISNAIDDGRFRAFVKFNGKVPTPASVPLFTVDSHAILDAPALPYLIADLSANVISDLPVSYNIESGNEDGIFSVTEEGLWFLVDDSTVDWSAPMQHNVIISINDGTLIAQAVQTVALGDITYADLVSESSMTNGGEISLDSVGMYDFTHNNSTRWPTGSMGSYLPEILPGETVTINWQASVAANVDNKPLELLLLGVLTSISRPWPPANTSLTSYTTIYRNDTDAAISPEILYRFNGLSANEVVASAKLGNMTYEIS